MELRDSIRNNWTTTGQELTKELRQFWQSSRPASPAPGVRVAPADNGNEQVEAPLSSPTAVSRLSHLDIPRPESPTGNIARGTSTDFATGYSLGLIGGVRSWVSTLSIAGLNGLDANSGTDDAQAHFIA